MPRARVEPHVVARRRKKHSAPMRRSRGHDSREGASAILAADRGRTASPHRARRPTRCLHCLRRFTHRPDRSCPKVVGPSAMLSTSRPPIGLSRLPRRAEARPRAGRRR
eukprot:7840040-Pyramimonas_sp.AAC.1